MMLFRKLGTPSQGVPCILAIALMTSTRTNASIMTKSMIVAIGFQTTFVTGIAIA